MESRLVQGDLSEYETLDEMVAAYVTAIRGAHCGPYRLLGFSLGGYVAGRVAARLEADGDEVEFVGVIDWDARQQLTPDARRESLVRLSVASYMFLQEEMGILRPRAESQLRDEISASSIWLPSGRRAAAGAFYQWVVENQLTTSKALEDVARQYLTRFEQHCRLLTRRPAASEFSARP